MLQRTLFALSLAVFATACDVPPIEGEGDRPTEGEGEEGEGDIVGEGEGDIVVGEGEGDIVVGEGEGDIVVGEGEGDVVVGEGEGDVVGGEGEGESGDGSCVTPFTARAGINRGAISANDRAELAGSCAGGRGGEDVWHFTTTPGARVVASVHAVDVTVSLDLFALDGCGPGQSELACSSDLGDDSVLVDLAPGVDSVDFVVDSFVARGSGAYTLTVGTPVDAGEGDTCDALHICTDALLCVAGTCVADDAAFCASTFDTAVGVANDAVPVGITQAPTCGGVGNAPRAGVSATHTMERDGDLVVRANSNSATIVEARDACGVGATALACTSVDFFGEFTLPGLLAGDVVELALFPGEVPSSFTVTERVTLAAGELCQPGDADAVCTAPLSCIGDGLGANRCINRADQLCTVITDVVAGTSTVDTRAAVDAADACGSFADGIGDKVLRFVVTKPQARVRVSSTTQGTSIILRDTCTGIDGACVDGFFNSEVTSPNLVLGDELFIVVSNNQPSQLTIIEDELLTIDPGQVCDPTSTTALCAPGFSCVGGPSPRPVTCSTVTVGNAVGDACLVGSTDQVCAAGLGCTANQCAVVAGALSGTLNAALRAGPTSTNRVGDDCQLAVGANVNFTRFTVTNNGDVAASLTATTNAAAGQGNDTVLGAYVPDFVSTNALTQCQVSNDDIGSPNLNSRVTASVPPHSTMALIVWPFAAGRTFNFSLAFTSTAPVVVTTP